MLTVTDSACAHISQMLDDANVPDGVAARFTLSDEGLGLEPDTAQPGDSTFEHDGRTVLLLDAQVSEILEERTLDTADSEEGVVLTLR